MKRVNVGNFGWVNNVDGQDAVLLIGARRAAGIWVYGLP